MHTYHQKACNATACSWGNWASTRTDFTHVGTIKLLIFSYTRPFSGLIKDMIPTMNTHSTTQNVETYIYRRPVSFSIPKEKAMSSYLPRTEQPRSPCCACCRQPEFWERAQAGPVQGKALDFPDYLWCPCKALSPLFLSVFFTNAKCSLSLSLSLSPESPLRQPLFLCPILCHWLFPWKSS